MFVAFVGELFSPHVGHSFSPLLISFFKNKSLVFFGFLVFILSFQIFRIKKDGVKSTSTAFEKSGSLLFGVFRFKVGYDTQLKFYDTYICMVLTICGTKITQRMESNFVIEVKQV